MGRLSRTKWCLLGCLAVVFVLVAGSVFVPGSLISTVEWFADNDFAYRLRSLWEREVVQGDTVIEMAVESIRVSKTDYQPVVILKEKGGELHLPIWIGLLEANAISVVLDGVKVPRPLTPDLLYSILDGMGASVDYIVITDIKDNIFYANISVKGNWTQMEIDARPSDAIAIALRTKAPIYVEKSVLDKAGIQPEHNEDRITAMHVE